MSTRGESLTARHLATEAIDWTAALPLVEAPLVTLRELRRPDAASLVQWLKRGDTWKFTARLPRSEAEFEWFIDEVDADRRLGRALCFGVVPHGLQGAVGLVFIRPLDVSFHACRCSIALGEAFYGTGVLAAAVEAAIDFAFRHLGPRRLDLRTSNRREGEVFARLGAVREGVLRQSWRPAGKDAADETIWSILREEWLASGRCRTGHVRTFPGHSRPAARRRADAVTDTACARPGWSAQLPTLAGDGVTLREADPDDAPHLLRVFSPADIRAWIDPPPLTEAQFRKYLAWARRERECGRVMCFAVADADGASPCGLVQVRRVDPRFRTAEWGIVLAASRRGTGLCSTVARLLLGFLFDQAGLERLEAQTTRQNLAALGSLRAVGAVREALLRRISLIDGQAIDQELWGILREDWREATRTSR